MIYQYETALSASLERDVIYQELLKSCLSLEADYVRIRDSLPEQDQELLERYISLCEELDHRRLTIALTI